MRINDKILKNVGKLMLAAGIIPAVAGRISGNVALFLLALLLFFCGSLVLERAEHVRRRENAKNPISTVEATVMGHRMETYHSRYSAAHRFYLTFKLADGEETLEFEVPEGDYQSFGTGDKGPLRYRTWEYLSFCAKDLSDVTPMVPLQEENASSPDEASATDGWEKAEKLLNMLAEQAARIMEKAKNRLNRDEKPMERAAEDDNSVLTHELDE